MDIRATDAARANLEQDLVRSGFSHCGALANERLADAVQSLCRVKGECSCSWTSGCGFGFMGNTRCGYENFPISGFGRKFDTALPAAPMSESCVAP
jgi:hypothetical protein